MIKVKITSKVGATFEKELPANIHEFYHALTEMGIRKTPRSILLMDDNAADVELTADSEIGSSLLRVFGKGDTLADANTVAFAVSTAREEILPELEQNILHNQYPTKEMLFDDIQAMTQAAGPVKLTFYCPLVGQLDDGECDEYIDVGSDFLTVYQDQIEQGIANEQAPEMGDMVQYLDRNAGVAAKLMSEEMADLREEILGQCSDGPGEGFEQRPIDTNEGNLYVSYETAVTIFLCTDQGMGSGPPPPPARILSAS